MSMARKYHSYTKEKTNINKGITSKRIQAGKVQAKGVGQYSDDSSASDVSMWVICLVS